MKFGDEEHRSLISRVDKLWDGLSELSELAREYDIDDIFQDNGAKTLQQLIVANLKVLPGREGNDAIDEEGQEWEMKSANICKVSGYSTHHHLNEVILAKYRSVPWLFSEYHHIELKRIFVMKPAQLEPLFEKWEAKLSQERLALNNPKIPLKFVATQGICIFDRATGLYPKNPSMALRDC